MFQYLKSAFIDSEEKQEDTGFLNMSGEKCLCTQNLVTHKTIELNSDRVNHCQMKKSIVRTLKIQPEYLTNI